MTAVSKTRDRTRRRDELLDAADAVIRARGPGASMEEIAAAAGVTKPILYRHFGDKEGLHEALAQRYVDALMSQLWAPRRAQDPRGRLAESIDAYLEFVEREPEQYRFLLDAAERPRTSGLVAEFRRRHAEACAIAHAESLRRAGLEPEMAEPWAHAVVGAVRSAGIWWLEHRSFPRERLVEHLTSLLWEGLSQLRSHPGKQ